MAVDVASSVLLNGITCVANWKIHRQGTTLGEISKDLLC